MASEARFRQLAETISQVFFLVDTQLTEFFYVSPAFEAIYGRTCESLVSDPAAWAGAVPAEERERLLSEIMPGGTLVAFDVEHRITRADGTTRAIRTRGFPVYNTAGEVYRFAGVSDDITEQRTLEAQVRQSAKMDAIGRLSAGVAHDFNNLLSVIIGFTELLMCDKSFAAVHSTDLEEILKAARRATGLTKQLLAFSRQQVLHAAPLDVNALITDMARMLNRLIGDHIHVALALAPNLSLALADRGQLEQVVMNLVVNARDAMPGGGRVTIETMDVELDNAVVHEETVTPGSYVMLAVTDTGTGMSKEVQRRVFEPFFTTKGVGKGTGLGLSTTYGIVKQSKGYLFVDSEPGKGATFRVYLPRSIREVESPSVSPAAGPPIVKGSETLLLVEDEDGVRELSKRILSNAGYQVLEAGDGLDAERIFLSHRGMIDLVITDVIMPGCGGPELVRRLQAHSPHVRVLYMSAYPEQSSAQRGGLDRNIPLLNKPFSAPDLVRLVREVLDGTVAIGGHA